jgi:hypothetical protein
MNMSSTERLDPELTPPNGTTIPVEALPIEPDERPTSPSLLPPPCSACRGTGMILDADYWESHEKAFASRCGRCNGTGNADPLAPSFIPEVWT